MKNHLFIAILVVGDSNFVLVNENASQYLGIRYDVIKCNNKTIKR